MTEKTIHAPGTFCWPELSSSDQRGAESFYTALFGWTIKETPMGPGEHYSIFLKDGQDVAAVAQLSKELAANHVPSNWLSYVSTNDINASIEQAKELGGTVMAGPFEVMELGSMAVLNDPIGATFALWQGKSHAGITLRDAPFSLIWTELMTPDPGKSAPFYTGLFGWTTEVMPMGAFDYTVLKRGDVSAGGMMPIAPEMGNVPPHWMPYFGVTDANATANKAKSLGAKALVEVNDIPGVGQMAVLEDPQGAVFSILQPAPGLK